MSKTLLAQIQLGLEIYCDLCARFEKLLSAALEDQTDHYQVSPPKQRSSASAPSINKLKDQIEEERKKSIEFEKRLQMYM